MKHIEIPMIEEKVDFISLNKLNLVNALFKNTEIADLANYPKRSNKIF